MYKIIQFPIKRRSTISIVREESESIFCRHSTVVHIYIRLFYTVDAVRLGRVELYTIYKLKEDTLSRAESPQREPSPRMVGMGGSLAKEFWTFEIHKM